ncbi:MAG: biopolymer transporter ExbD [Prevotella sp.]|nr:biopolymer transporter ExbD [Prevotella sp.]
MFSRRRREIPGLNTTSTSDISFMMLVFFLVT